VSARSREPRKAVISIGTNSTRALVVEFEPAPKILLQRSTGTRIGEGLRESGRLREDAMLRTLEAIEEHATAMRQFRAELKVIATSAVRRADNADEFARAVEASTGVPLEIISGEEEARCSYEGAVLGLPAEQTYGVLDVGGGSSEYATRDANVSLEMGAVRLTERFPALREIAGADEIERAQADTGTTLAPLEHFTGVDRLIMVGGSATTALAVISGRRMTEPHGPLTRAALRKLIHRLASLPLEKRKEIPGMVAQRADILLAGTLILDEACALTGHAEALVSTNDLLLGYLLRH
jgi:exopolyphosphatase/guanosine-5'-triphosphate,3'-diphosphate pyrophosphatase